MGQVESGTKHTEAPIAYELSIKGKLEAEPALEGLLALATNVLMRSCVFAGVSVGSILAKVDHDPYFDGIALEVQPTALPKPDPYIFVCSPLSIVREGWKDFAYGLSEGQRNLLHHNITFVIKTLPYSN